MAYNYNPYYPAFNNGASPDMLNQYKGQYQQMSMQQMQPQPIQQTIPQPMPMTSNDMLWVLGEVEATSYPVAPNNTVILWDKNQPTIYIKSANMQGVPSMRILDFTERNANAPKTPEEHHCKCGDKFVPKEDFEALQGKFKALEEKVESLTAKPTPKTTKKTEVE